MEAPEGSPVLPACCFVPWRGVLSSKRVNQVVPTDNIPAGNEHVVSDPSHDPREGVQGAKMEVFEEARMAKTRGETLPKPIIPGFGRGSVNGGRSSLGGLTIEIGEGHEGSFTGGLCSATSASSSGTDCKPIPAGTPLWNALLHQSPSREPIRKQCAELQVESTGSYQASVIVGGSSAGQVSMIKGSGRANVFCSAVTSAPPELRILVPLHQDAAAEQIHAASGEESSRSRSGVMTPGGPAGCLQCAASAGALNAMRRYWEQAEQRAREAEAAVTRMERKEKRMLAQLAALLMQVELRQVQVDHLSGLVAQQQATLLALKERSREQSGQVQGPLEELSMPTASSNIRVEEPPVKLQEGFQDDEQRAEEVGNDPSGVAESGKEKKRAEKASVASSHQHDVSEEGIRKAEGKRVVRRGVSLDAWAEAGDQSNSESERGANGADSESEAESSFEFDTSPLAVLSASSSEAEGQEGSPGVRRKERGSQEGRGKVIVEELADSAADPEGAQRAFGEVFQLPSMVESRPEVEMGTRESDGASGCKSAGEGSSPAGIVSEALEEERPSEKQGSGEGGIGGQEGAALNSGEASGSDQQVGSAEGRDGGSLGDELEQAAGAVNGIGFELQGVSGRQTGDGEEGGKAETELTRSPIELVKGNVQRMAWGRADAESSCAGCAVVQEAQEEGRESNGEHTQGSRSPKEKNVVSTFGAEQGGDMRVKVEGGESSFQVGLSELMPGGVHDETTRRSSWPVSAAGTPQTSFTSGRQEKGPLEESDGGVLEQNGRAHTVDGRSGGCAWGMIPLEIAQEVVVESFDTEELGSWRRGNVSESGTASQTSADAFEAGSPPETPLLECFGEGFAQLGTPRDAAQKRQGAWGGSPKLIPYSPRGPRANPPSPRVISPKTVVPAPPLNPHFASDPEVPEKLVGTTAGLRITANRGVALHGDLAAATQRLDTRAGKLFRKDSLPRRNNTSDPFGLQEAALVPHPPSVAAPVRKPSTREKQLAANVGGRRSSDKENDFPKAPTVTLRLEGLRFGRKQEDQTETRRRVGLDMLQMSGLESGTGWGLIGGVVDSEVTSPEPPSKPRTTTSRPQFRALRPVAS